MTFDMVKFLHAFQFTSTDFPMRVFLHLCRFHITDLYLDQLVTLADWLQDMPQSKESQLLLEGIRLAVPLSQHSIDSLLPWEKLRLIEMFGKDVSAEFIEELIRGLLQEEDDLEVNEAARLLNKLMTSEVNTQTGVKLTNCCVTHIVNGVEEIEPGDLLHIVQSVRGRCNDDVYVTLLVKTSHRLTCVGDCFNHNMLLLWLQWDACVFDVKFLYHVIDLFHSRLTNDCDVNVDHLLCLAR